MGKVKFGLSVSLDGFIADKDDDVSEVFAWFVNGWERFYKTRRCVHTSAFTFTLPNCPTSSMSFRSLRYISICCSACVITS